MDQKEFQEVLAFAVGREEEAEVFYQEASRKARSPHMKEAFLQMAGEEQKHRELLTTLNMGAVVGTKIEGIPDLKLADQLTDVGYGPDMTYQDILILAMKREKGAFLLYNGIAEHSDDADLRRLFQILAQEEARHKLKLETEYDQCVLEGY